jgi:multiple sugar transport system ATP-binding protein
MTDGDYVVGIRPEDITDTETGDFDQSKILRFSSRVNVVEPAGSDTFVVTQVCGQSITCRVRGDSQIKEGEQAEFLLNVDRLHVFDKASGQRIKRNVS